MKINCLINYRLTKAIPIALLFSFMLATAAFSQPVNSAKTAVNPIDPALIDISEPTLFTVPYTHLDDVWRWSNPQVIRDFLKIP